MMNTLRSRLLACSMALAIAAAACAPAAPTPTLTSRPPTQAATATTEAAAETVEATGGASAATAEMSMEATMMATDDMTMESTMMDMETMETTDDDVLQNATVTSDPNIDNTAESFVASPENTAEVATAESMDGGEIVSGSSDDMTAMASTDMMTMEATMVATDDMMMTETATEEMMMTTEATMMATDDMTMEAAGEMMTAEATMADEQTILELAMATDDLSTLVAAIEAADLVDALNGEGPFTVFAPTNEAFEALLAEMDMTAEELLAQPELLQTVLLYHVVSARAVSTMITNGLSLTTLNGETLTFAFDGSDVVINDTARVVTADIVASNGIVHIIDAVLLPNSLAGADATPEMTMEMMATEVMMDMTMEATADMMMATAEATADMVMSDATMEMMATEVMMDMTADATMDMVMSDATMEMMATEVMMDMTMEATADMVMSDATMEMMATEVMMDMTMEATMDMVMGTAEATMSPVDTAIDMAGSVVVAPDGNLVLAVAVALSGEGLAPLGEDIRRGAELALEERPTVTIDGVEFTVTLDAQDDLCSAEGGQAIANRFVSDAQVVGVVGPMCSSACRAAAPIFDAAGYTSISPSCTAADLTTSGYSSFNRAVASDAFQSIVVAEYIYNTIGARRVATIHDGSPYGEGLVEIMSQRFTELGGEVVASDAISVGDTDFRSLLEDIAQESPDLIYFGGFPAEAARLASQRADAGLEDVTFMGADGINTNEFIELAGDAADGVYASKSIPASGEALDTFLARYLERYGEEPPAPFHANGYDATNIFLNAIEAVGYLDEAGNLVIDRGALLASVRGVTDFQGLTGVLNGDGSGELSSASFGISQITGGAFVQIAVGAVEDGEVVITEGS